MLRRLAVSVRLLQHSSRQLSSSASSSNGNNNGNGKTKDPSIKEILDENILKAIDNIVEQRHPEDKDAKKETKKTLFARLTSIEKEKFEAASKAPMNELLMDENFKNLIEDYAQQTKKEKTTFTRVKVRDEIRALASLRQEIFHQCLNSGMTAIESRKRSEEYVERAQKKLKVKREEMNEETKKEIEKIEEEERQMNERDRKLFDLAMATIEKMYEDPRAEAVFMGRQVVEPDEANTPPLFDSKHASTLKLWTNLNSTKENSLKFWVEWNERAANVMNKSFGPENAFEEQIVWTKKGMQWPFPIDNEYMMGEEADVPFIEHVMLERYLADLGIPKDGPIGHFMHLVCVGLSKNPYMTAQKKREHLLWFSEYFNEEKQKLIHKLHQQDQAIAHAQ